MQDVNATSKVVLDTLHGLLAELGNRPGEIRPTSDLERDLGLGSLERVELIVRLEQRLSVKLPDATLAQGQTPKALIDLVSTHLVGIDDAPAHTAAARITSRSHAENGHAENGRAENGRGANGHANGAVHGRTTPTPRPDMRGFHPPASVRTLVDLARFRADVDGDRAHLFLVQDDGTDRPLSFAELWRRGLRTAAGLAELGVKPGDRVAIILPTGPEFFTTFLGILCAGCVPVPLYPPVRLNDLPAYVEREMHILGSAGARVLVTDRQLLQVGKLLEDRFPSLVAIASSDLERADTGFGVARVSPEDLALIQYSSGSTGDPKGVALSHRALMTNARALGDGLSFGPADVPVSWLPLYHDMGLIGTWLAPFLHGMQVAMLSPLQFLSRPERWLWAFHNYRGSISPAPNFGYDLCCRKVKDEDIQGLDLSSWRSAMNGSEPVRAETIDRFCGRFEAYGFRREAMMPVYGLAETSVALAFPPVLRAPRLDRIDAGVFAAEGRAEPAADGGLAFASCGRALGGHEIRIVDADAPRADDARDVEPAALPERAQGRIFFRGPSSMSGYFGRPDATAEVRHGEWIDTGDLGYLADGEVYVTGRIKDLIIKGGRKYHAHDIEQAVQPLQGIRKGCVVAFDVRDDAGGEAIVVLAESHEPAARHAEIAAAIVAAVQQKVGAPPDRVHVLRPGSLPKTSSGKLRRRESRARYQSGAFDRAPSKKTAALRLVAETVLRRTGASVRRFGRSAHSVYATTAAAATVVPGFALVSLLCRTEGATWRGGRLVLRAGTTLAGLPIRRSGPPVPETGAILVSNHASYLDWLVLTLAIEQPFLFTAKSSVFSMPVLGTIVRRLGHIQVERGLVAGKQRGYKAAADAARKGRLVHFFPEATFTSAGGLRPFRLGAFQLAAETGLPIIPIAICGTRQALRDERVLLDPGRIEVKVLDPIAPPAPELRAVARVRDEVRDLLAREVGEPVLDIVTAGLPEEVIA